MLLWVEEFLFQCYGYQIYGIAYCDIVGAVVLVNLDTQLSIAAESA